MLGHLGDDLVADDLGREAVASVAAKAQMVVGQGQMPLLDYRRRQLVRRFHGGFLVGGKFFSRRPVFPRWMLVDGQRPLWLGGGEKKLVYDDHWAATFPFPLCEKKLARASAKADTPRYSRGVKRGKKDLPCLPKDSVRYGLKRSKQGRFR